jgi:hypothetical protein
MFYRNLQRLQTRKNKKQSGEKRCCLRIISHYGNFAGIIIFPPDDKRILMIKSGNDYWLIGLSIF